MEPTILRRYAYRSVPLQVKKSFIYKILTPFLSILDPCKLSNTEGVFLRPTLLGG